MLEIKFTYLKVVFGFVVVNREARNTLAPHVARKPYRQPNGVKHETELEMEANQATFPHVYIRSIRPVGGIISLSNKVYQSKIKRKQSRTTMRNIN